MLPHVPLITIKLLHLCGQCTAPPASSSPSMVDGYLLRRYFAIIYYAIYYTVLIYYFVCILLTFFLSVSYYYRCYFYICTTSAPPIHFPTSFQQCTLSSKSSQTNRPIRGRPFLPTVNAYFTIILVRWGGPANGCRRC